MAHFAISLRFVCKFWIGTIQLLYQRLLNHRLLFMRLLTHLYFRHIALSNLIGPLHFIRGVHCVTISHQRRLRSINTVSKIYQSRKKMRRKIMAGNQYSKLSQGDEEIACEFVRRENQSHENDARRRLITACVFCTVFIICEVIGK